MQCGVDAPSAVSYAAIVGCHGRAQPHAAGAVSSENEANVTPVPFPPPGQSPAEMPRASLSVSEIPSQKHQPQQQKSPLPEEDSEKESAVAAAKKGEWAKKKESAQKKEEEEFMPLAAAANFEKINTVGGGSPGYESFMQVQRWLEDLEVDEAVRHRFLEEEIDVQAVQMVHAPPHLLHKTSSFLLFVCLTSSLSVWRHPLTPFHPFYDSTPD